MKNINLLSVVRRQYVFLQKKNYLSTHFLKHFFKSHNSLNGINSEEIEKKLEVLLNKIVATIFYTVYASFVDDDYYFRDYRYIAV